MRRSPPPSRILFSDVVITAELAARGGVSYRDETPALQHLARAMIDDPAGVLPRFVELAMDSSDAVAAGLSLFEPEPEPVFRWRHVQGRLAPFEGSTTPRDYSPCGVTIDQRAPILCAHPERYYEWIADAHIVVPEVLLVPLYLGRDDPFGTLWVVSDEPGHFDQHHARELSELASFVSIALRLERAEAELASATVPASALPPTAEAAVAAPASLALVRRLSTRGLDAGDADALAGAFVGRTTVARGAVVAPSDPDRSLVVQSGFACVSRFFGDGRRQIVRLLLPGDLVPCETGDALVEALSPCEIDEIGAADLEAVVRARPGVAAALERDRARSDARFLCWVAALAGRNAEARIAHLICELCERLAEVGLVDVGLAAEAAPGETSFDMPLTQQVIAEIAGLSLVHTNKSLRRLADRGALAIKAQTVRLTDPAALRRLADFTPNARGTTTRATVGA